MSRYGVFSSPYFPAIRLNKLYRLNNPNTGKYEPEKALYLDTFNAVSAYAKTPWQHLILKRNEIKEMINPLEFGVH